MRRSIRLACERLEPRLVLATSTLDPTFGQGGLVFGPTNVRNATATQLSDPTAVAVQADGKVVVAGLIQGTSYDAEGHLAVRRFNADGSVDQTFGTGGQESIAAPAMYDGAYSPLNLAIQSDGKIVLASIAGVDDAHQNMGLPSQINYVARLTTSGQLDSTFGVAGEATIPIADGAFSAVAVQADGRILLGGTASQSSEAQLAVVRLTAAGVLDPTFNGTGEQVVTLPSPAPSLQFVNFEAFTLTPSGQILLMAQNSVSISGTNPVVSFVTDVVRLTPAGALDATFGTDGLVDASDAGFTLAVDMAVQADGRIVLVGDAGHTSDGVAATAVIRLATDGSPDPTFHRYTSAGSTAVDHGAAYKRMAIGPDGQIAIVGTLQATNSIAVRRFLADGTVDPNFGVAGAALISVRSTPAATPSNPDYPKLFGTAVAFTADNKVVAAGQATVGGFG